ncbi:MAG: type II toxin-antitoxin system RelE/ParE family toxin [Bacteroidota bacterium]|nr:type II toxin-antitoxin system RelE/ParE family toxin [Bacteroidota bacterium]
MAYKIVWTKNAREDLKEIVSYLTETWSFETAQNFITELYSKLDILSNYPYSGRPSLNKNIRKILITKHNYLYYKIEDDKVRLLDFFDNRQDPDKDKYV